MPSRDEILLQMRFIFKYSPNHLFYIVSNPSLFAILIVKVPIYTIGAAVQYAKEASIAELVALRIVGASFALELSRSSSDLCVMKRT